MIYCFLYINIGTAFQLLYLINIFKMAAELCKSVLSRSQLPAIVLDTLYNINMTPLPGYWDTDHDRCTDHNRQRTMTYYKAQYTNIISKHPTCSLHTSIVLIASIILTASRKYVHIATIWPENANVAAMLMAKP